jgi:tRNA (guanine-N7-)-methyltransferase
MNSGRLHFATDVADYFAETMEMLNDVPSLQPMTVPDPGEHLTNFERKYRQEGRQIHRAQYQKQ